jgi:hypothetical protein
VNKTLDTLADDVYAILGKGVATPSDEQLLELGKAIAQHVKRALEVQEPGPSVRPSNLGIKCDRKPWYNEHGDHSKKETIQPYALIKFLLGHVYEEIGLFLIEQAGHEVKQRQRKVNVLGVEGSLDAVIDGVVSDVKTASGYGMRKFKNNGLREDDPFGYMMQINTYAEGLKDDPDVRDRSRVAFIAFDKESGRIVVDQYNRTDEDRALVGEAIARKQSAVARSTPPERGHSSRHDGASGNMALGTECSYCEWKKECWPGVRTFLYASGPKFLTEVKREPDVPEVK